MKPLNSGYARYHKEKYRRDEPLFRDRHRGGKKSDARKIFVYVAAREYGVPTRIIVDYCHVGQAAVSALTRAGYEVAKKRGLDISLF